MLSKGYERYFSEYSYGFRPNRSQHMAIEKVLEYLNEGCEWVVDLDIEKYFDTVNHDKLISILRERMTPGLKGRKQCDSRCWRPFAGASISFRSAIPTAIGEGRRML